MTSSTAVRSIPMAHWRFALVAGVVLGVTLGAANQMFNLSRHWNNVYAAFVQSICLTLALVPLLAWANRPRSTRLPRWIRFVAAGALASGIAVGVQILHAAFVLGIPAGGGLPFFWVEFPTLLMTSTLAALGYMHWNDVASRARALHDAQVQRLRVTRDAYEARLAALQARVDPDFLFAALSDVESLYESDAAAAARVLENLIVHLRAALPAIDETASSMAVELTLVETWLDIRRVRMKDRLTVAIASTNAPSDAKLPPMVLLPLVQHATEAASGGHCAILVSAERVESRIAITIIGPAPAFSPTTSSAAIAQIRDRIEALYGDSGRLVLEQIALDRSQATLEVPYDHTDRRPR